MNVLVTGGSASGKSLWAETLALRLSGPHIYVATMQSFGDAGARRVARHRAQRAGKGFVTVECPCNLAAFVADGMLPHGSSQGTALLEDVGNLVANELFDDAGRERFAEAAMTDALHGVEALAASCANVVAVTNEVGADGRAYDESTQRYIRCLGGVSNRVAAAFDVVVECVAGMPSVVKGALP